MFAEWEGEGRQSRRPEKKGEKKTQNSNRVFTGLQGYAAVQEGGKGNANESGGESAALSRSFCPSVGRSGRGEKRGYYSRVEICDATRREGTKMKNSISIHGDIKHARGAERGRGASDTSHLYATVGTQA